MPLREVGPSQRLEFPYQAIGVIFVTFPDGTQRQGTAAVVGRNDIMTAGHVVFNPDWGGWADSFEFYFGVDYNNTTGYFDSYDYAYSLTGEYGWEAVTWSDGLYSDNDNQTSLTSESQYDVALIGVSHPIGDHTGWLGTSAGENNSQYLNSVGYPAGTTGMMSDVIYVTKDSFYEVYTSIDDEMGPGSSGGPLFTDDGFLVGVKATGGDTGGTWADIGHLFGSIDEEMESNDSLLDNLPLVPTFDVVPSDFIVDEGDRITFTVATTNVEPGTELYYYIVGVQSADLGGADLTGFVTIDAGGSATVDFNVMADRDTEGSEYLGFYVETADTSVLVRDTSTYKGPTDAAQVFVFKSLDTGPGIGPATHAYFYTASEDEANSIRNRPDWPWVEFHSTFEAAHSNPTDSVPVYRFWSDRNQSHFFTISEAEKTQIIERSATNYNGYDWDYEGIGFGVYTNSSPRDNDGNAAIPVYRMWIEDKDFDPSNGYAGGHYFTADESEYDEMISLVGISGEGVAFYGEPLG